jgi:hypothetical protein
MCRIDQKQGKVGLMRRLDHTRQDFVMHMSDKLINGCMSIYRSPERK